MHLSSITTYVFIYFFHHQAFAQPCQLEGNIKGLGSKQIIISYELKGSSKVDTVQSTNDKFRYTARPSDDEQFRLYLDPTNLGRFTRLWYEPGTIKVSGSTENPTRLTVTGTKENNILNRYNQTIEWKFEDRRKGQPDSIRTLLIEEKQKETLHFIRTYPTAKTSAHLLYWQTFFKEEFLDIHDELFKSLSPSVQASVQGRQLADRLKSLQNQPRTGKKAPSFTLADTTGRPVVLSSFLGKYLLLDFWGHWCAPCIKAFPKLKNLNEQYAGKLLIIGIAAESEEEKKQWIQAIRVNNLNWVHVSELKGEKGRVNEQYNISAYPTYLLLDKQGVIIERAESIEKIQKRIILLNDL